MEDVFKQWLSTKSEVSKKEKEFAEIEKTVSGLKNSLVGQISSDYYTRYKIALHDLKDKESKLMSLKDKHKEYQEEIMEIFKENEGLSMRVRNEDSQHDKIIFLVNGVITVETEY